MEKNCERLLKKIKVLLSRIDDVIVQDKTSDMETVSFTPSMLTELADELRSTLGQTPGLFRAENFFYNPDGDYCICPMGQKMSRAGRDA